MTLQAGTKLGTYEVVALLGAGGMGEVYRARDTKLGRDVAIKVLPESFATNEERLARFEREAHLLASLNHPGIATIHGLEEADGVRFLAMELVEGETLAERIAHSPVSWDDALPWFEQMADALHAAHEKGIVHRDLKPANVMLTPEGRVKILDFGLAKALHPAADAQNASQSPTLTKDTALGAIVGTAAYVSPEQARGKQVDKRTDVWAFGCLVYEVLTGKKAFVGETVSDTIAAILEREPDWDRLPASLPENARRFLSRCLKKDATSRLHDIADARIEILDPPRVVGVPARRSSRAWPLAAAALGVVALIAILTNLGDGRSVPPRPVAHFVLDGPPVYVGRTGDVSTLAISRDGSKLVYISRAASGENNLYLRRLNEPETVPIPGTERPTGPFFAFDGNHIGFSADGAIKTVALEGGAVQSLAGATNARGAVWVEPDTIVFTPNSDAGLFRLAGSGGEAEPLTQLRLERGERSHRWPAILPGGEAVIFTVADRKIATFDDAAIAVQSFDGGGEHRILAVGGSYAQYVPTGHLVYGRAGALLAAPFDLDRLELTGPAVTVVEGVVTQPGDGAVHFAVSESGTLAYTAGRPMNLNRKLVWVDRSGTTTTLPATSGGFYTVRLSPSADAAAVDIDGANMHMWLYEMERDTMSRLTFEWNNAWPVWSSDGARLVFGSSRSGSGWDLFEQAVDGTGEATRLTESDLQEKPMSYTSDGRHVAFVELSPQTQSDIWILPRDGESFPLMNTSFNESYPQFSPDGHWLAYTSDETGQDEVFVQPYPGSGLKRRVSTGGGTMPLWRRDGKELYYRGEGSIMAVPVSLAPTFESGSPHALFEDRFLVPVSFFPGFTYDVAPDGSRFLMIEPDEPPSEPERIHVVLNWFQELERLVPTGR